MLEMNIKYNGHNGVLFPFWGGGGGGGGRGPFLSGFNRRAKN